MSDIRTIVPKKELYEKQHICRLNRIEIKDPKGWDTAQVEEDDINNIEDKIRKQSVFIMKNVKKVGNSVKEVVKDVITGNKSPNNAEN